MDDLKDKVICVVDYGNYVYVAQKMAETYGTVFYYNPSWRTEFPTWNAQMIGAGVPDIEVIDSIWPYYDDIDLFIFTNLFEGNFQEWLRSEGKLVFGSGIGDVMETDRAYLKDLMKELKMPVNNYEVVEGLDKLEKYLENKENKFIKTSNNYRGDIGTFHFNNMKISRSVFDMYKHTLGLAKYKEVFIVEDPIEDAIEIGCDMVVIDGKYPSRGMWGMEVKDSLYFSVITEYNNFPDPIKYVNQRLESPFKSFGYKGPYSSEIRVTKKGTPYLTDITCRFPSPPSSLLMESYDNFGEIVWMVANGQVPEIKNTYKYGVEIIIKSENAKTEPQAIYFPKDISKYVKIKNLAIIDGVYYYICNNVEVEEIASVIGLGNTLEDAIKHATDNASKIEGYDLRINCDIIDKAKKQIEKMPEYGIKFD